MKKFGKPLLAVMMLSIAISLQSFSQEIIKPEKITKAVYFDKSPELRTIDVVPYGIRKRTWKNRLVPNKLSIDDELSRKEAMTGDDPVRQDKIIFEGRNTGSVVQNFGGITNTYSVAPPDTDGDVGHDHYMQMVNQGYAIWDKEGNLLHGPSDNISLWNGFEGPWSSTNDGDPIVLYDEYADRWIATQFSLPFHPTGPYYELVAVSATSDPLGEWYRYAFEFDNMPDYPKFGVWPDGYYFSTHQFAGGQWAGGGMSVLDREAMINGDPDAVMVYFNVGYNNYGLLPADADGAIQPPEGSPNYIVDIGDNTIKMWQVEMDWENTTNSTITSLPNLATEPFNTQDIHIYQPNGQQLDALQGMTMYRLQYRNFGDYEVMLTNHTVNAGSGVAGIRWYELRNYGSGWSIYQQSTYSPDDGNNRWMGSIAMNQNGDIALGYSVAGSSTHPSIRVAGQSSNTPLGLGVMDIDETSIFEGEKSQSGVSRWGDYSNMSIDPEDGNTFWFTTEYSNGGWGWKTQIGAIELLQIPEADFTSDEVLIPVGETINFTDLTSGIPAHWSWTFNGADPASSTEQNPEDILYETEGEYSVKLVATNALGTDSIVKESYITVSSTVLPEVDFTSNFNTFCTGDTITFEDLTEISPIQWLWEFSPSDVVFVNGTSETSQNPQVIFLSEGLYDVSLTSWNLNGPAELTKAGMIKSGGAFPYFIETFEDDGFRTNNWIIENPDNDVTWEMYEVGGTTPGNHAAAVNFRNYFAIAQRDRLISPPFNLKGIENATLEFQYAYAQNTEAMPYTDSLIVYVSGDCGGTWTRIFAGGEDGTGNFATHEPTDYDFFPEVPSDWCMEGWGAGCKMLNIADWTGLSDVRIAFETFSYFGNPIFVDNIAVTQTVGIDNENADNNNDFRVFPIPTTGDFTVVLPNNNTYEKLTVVNQLGQKLFIEEISENSERVVVTNKNLQSGIYFITLSGKNTIKTKKIIVN